jgi:hypothetical protein
MQHSDIGACLGGETRIELRFAEELPDQAQCYHSNCWETGKMTKKGRHITPQQLLRFAESSMYLYILPARQSLEPYMPSSEPTGVMESLAYPDMTLGERIMSLPPELIELVMEYAKPSPASSTLRILTHGIIDLLRSVSPSLYQELTCTITRLITLFFVGL